MAFNGTTMHVNGIDLNVVIAGEGPDVLLVHGFPDDHEVWRHQIPALVAAGYRVIAPDTRGCGLSAIAPHTSDYKLKYLVADLVALLDHLGIDKVRLVGHDWGAVIAWHLAMAHPERIDRYAALSVGHPTAYARGPVEQKLKGWYVLMFQLRGFAEFILKAFGWKLFRVLTRYPEEARHWIPKLARPGRLTAAINYYRANAALLSPKDRAKVKAPVMGIFSTGDKFLAEQQMIESAAWVDGPFRYERVEGAIHWLQLDAPDRVNALLLDYLK